MMLLINHVYYFQIEFLILQIITSNGKKEYLYFFLDKLISLLTQNCPGVASKFVFRQM
jgi:hypothetical protein